MPENVLDALSGGSQSPVKYQLYGDVHKKRVYRVIRIDPDDQEQTLIFDYRHTLQPFWGFNTGGKGYYVRVSNNLPEFNSFPGSLPTKTYATVEGITNSGVFNQELGFSEIEFNNLNYNSTFSLTAIWNVVEKPGEPDFVWDEFEGARATGGGAWVPAIPWVMNVEKVSLPNPSFVSQQNWSYSHSSNIEFSITLRINNNYGPHDNLYFTMRTRVRKDPDTFLVAGQGTSANDNITQTYSSLYVNTWYEFITHNNQFLSPDFNNSDLITTNSYGLMVPGFISTGYENGPDYLKFGLRNNYNNHTTLNDLKDPGAPNLKIASQYRIKKFTESSSDWSNWRTVYTENENILNQEVHVTTSSSDNKNIEPSTQYNIQIRNAPDSSDGYPWIISSNNPNFSRASTSGYTVSFNSNGGSGSMSDQAFLPDTSQSLNSNTFTRDGYGFLGWATGSEGSVVYTNGQSITVSSSMTLYAVWNQTMIVGWVSGGSSPIGPNVCTIPEHRGRVRCDSSTEKEWAPSGDLLTTQPSGTIVTTLPDPSLYNVGDTLYLESVVFGTTYWQEHIVVLGTVYSNCERCEEI